MRKEFGLKAWHLFSCCLWRILSPTIAIFFCQQLDLPPLRFADLIID